MTQNKFIIRTTIYNSMEANAIPVSETEFETDTLNNKPTLKDIYNLAKTNKCANLIFVNITVEDIDGNYIDSDEAAMSFDYENGKIFVIEETMEVEVDV